MNYMCEILEDEKNLVKINHLQNPQLRVVSTKQLYAFSHLLAYSCFPTAHN
jgi:hypothetical protein